MLTYALGSTLIIPMKDYQFKTKEFKILSIRESCVDNPLLDTPDRVVDFWKKEVFKSLRYDKEKETLIVFLLNTRRRITGFEIISNGTLDTLLVHPREVFRVACIANAAAIIVGHNHPSGDPTPSEADIRVTRELI